eukprot:gnl/TRDRNA2_/TRDRNA2_43886_c0_seq1.p1 gnl/TRDRNA2_/TRDRNA2_43886_c0~~gnl/TRDRNA2_/TRDRNA2_43886_c0_seq1.p1  ORF type:complete len:326 (-),score=52.78 gnl/TRDRNA2_/TRDRNA2_43886_c0_seq1:101-1078(-)
MPSRIVAVIVLLEVFPVDEVAAQTAANSPTDVVDLDVTTVGRPGKALHAPQTPLSKLQAVETAILNRFSLQRSRPPQPGIKAQLQQSDHPQRIDTVLNRRSILFGTAATAAAAVTASGAQAAEGTTLNVYGETMQQCGSSPGSGEGDFCTYRNYDKGAHQVCVDALPSSFSSRTGQGRWSDSYTGQSWCICIWAYANYYLSYGDDDLPIKCDALPAEVLESQYSSNKWRNCGPMSSQCSKFRDAIRRMCRTCDLQASSQSAKKTLRSKCQMLEAQMKLAQAEPMSAFAEDVSFHSFQDSFASALIGLATGSGVALAVLHVRRGRP